MSPIKYKYLDTRECLTVVVGGRTYAVSSASPVHHELVSAVKAGLAYSVVLEILNRKSEAARKAVDLLNKGKLSGRLRYEDGVILLEGRVLHNFAAQRLARLLEQGHDVRALAAFVEKQERNPNQEMIDHLYEFLEFGKIPLTPDGDFLVYKAVRADYFDIHSGKFLNNVGAEPSVPRESVDPDRNQTCSRGLHVCSYAYLPHFAHADGHVMMCKVDPADVVAIPSDYNNTKMRVCRYKVVAEVTTYYNRSEDVLGDGPTLREPSHEVWYEEGGREQLYDAFYTQDEADIQALALRDNSDGGKVWVKTRS